VVIINYYIAKSAKTISNSAFSFVVQKFCIVVIFLIKGMFHHCIPYSLKKKLSIKKIF
jgi:uncharacterized membrane protein